jgi:hypothetical protein
VTVVSSACRANRYPPLRFGPAAASQARRCFTYPNTLPMPMPMPGQCVQYNTFVPKQHVELLGARRVTSEPGGDTQHGTRGQLLARRLEMKDALVAREVAVHHRVVLRPDWSAGARARVSTNGQPPFLI